MTHFGMTHYRRLMFCMLAASVFALAAGTGAFAAAGPASQPPQPPRTQPSPVVQGQPFIYFPQVAYDFGEVTESAEVSHDFSVRNTGAGVLNIDRVKTS